LTPAGRIWFHKSIVQ